MTSPSWERQPGIGGPRATSPYPPAPRSTPPRSAPSQLPQPRPASHPVFDLETTCLRLHRPWKGVCAAGGVPLKVTNGEHPDAQIQAATPEVRALIEACWVTDPRGRLAAGEVVKRLRAMMMTGQE